MPEKMSEIAKIRVVLGCLVMISITSALITLGHAQGVQGKIAVNGKVTITTTGHSVSLSWSASPGATSYNAYRGTTHGGPYTKIATGIVTTNFADLQVTQNQTLYYVVTAVDGSVESGYSNEVVVTVP